MNDKNPLVIIGIPVFNGEKLLKKRMESILNQTYQNFEIIISDNASTDNTSKICKEFLENNFTNPIFCSLDTKDYVVHKNKKPFELKHFIKFPKDEFSGK